MKSQQKRPFFYAISGYKHTGKTTLITKLIPVLVERGYHVAVIKHDGHDFEGDVPGTDSYKMKKSGAYGTAVFSNNRILIHKEFVNNSENIDSNKQLYGEPPINEKEIALAFPEADIILLEGFKNADYPKYWCKYPEEELMEPDALADVIITQYLDFHTE